MAAESHIERLIVEFAKRQRCLTFKFTSPSQRGVPDRIFISLSGKVLFLEIKAPGKRPEPIQLRMMQKLRDQKVAAGWTDDLERGQEMILNLIHTPGLINVLFPL